MAMNAEEHILESYKNPHTLKFPPKDGNEDYRYPGILTDNRARDSATRSPTDWSKPRPDLRAGPKYPIDNSVIDVVRTVLEHSLQKFRIGETPYRHWTRYFRFSGDQIDERTRRKYQWTESNQLVWEKGAYVNTNQFVAIDWLQSEFLPLILNSETAHTALLVGPPGSGKSTFLKYLLTVQSDVFHAQEVITSRFEFMKFMREMLRTDLIGSLQRYLSFIHLRDLFLHHFFVKNTGTWKIRFNYSIQSNLDCELSAVADVWSKNCVLVGVQQSGDLIEELRALFEASKRSTKEYSKALKGLSHGRRLALLLSLNRTGMRVLTIFDGVDYVSIEDMLDNSHLKPIVMQILGARAEICNYFSPGLVRWSTASIVVIRENTLGLLEREPEVSRVNKDIYHIGQIDARVALLNAIQRSLDTAYTNHQIGPNSLDASRLMKAVEMTVSTLAASSGRMVLNATIYAMFCGNLRHIMEFLRVLFEWIVTETIREKILVPPFPVSPSEVIERLTSLAAHKIVRRRSYRMIELILLPRFGWFENGFRVVERDPFVDAGTSANGVRILSNESHHGFVDNIFNYHTVQSPPVPDSHALLEKIRILQILRRRNANFLTIETSLLSLFGYKSNDLRTSIFILLKSQMIESVIDRTGSQTSTIFSLTGKGRVCLESLIFNIAYLEHVFHKTLFPARMLRMRSDDQPRQASVFRWSVRSIANVYAFVCYISFVENNNASGKTVPEEFRISRRIAESVCAAVRKILKTEARSHQIGDDTGSGAPLDLADEVWRRLDGQANIWRISGLIA